MPPTPNLAKLGENPGARLPSSPLLHPTRPLPENTGVYILSSHLLHSVIPLSLPENPGIWAHSPNSSQGMQAMSYLGAGLVWTPPGRRGNQGT